MIRVQVQYGKADRKTTVSDDLIADTVSAVARGTQELYSHVKMTHAREVAIPHEPEMQHGVKRFFTLPLLGIVGQHLVTAETIDISNGVISTTVSIEQWSDMPQMG